MAPFTLNVELSSVKPVWYLEMSLLVILNLVKFILKVSLPQQL